MAEETEDKSSKTEDPTDRKLQDARKKGDVASSREAGVFMGVFALFLITTFVGPAILPSVASILGNLFDVAGQIEVGAGQAGVTDLSIIGTHLATSLVPYLGAIAVLLLVAGFLGVALQGDVVASPERIKPKLSNISFGSGFRRVYGVQALVEFLKNTAKLAIVAVIALLVARAAILELLPGGGVSPEALLGLFREDAAWMLLAVSAFLVPIAIADGLWKRFQWLKKHRMSKKELKDEHKDSEGSPEIKGKRAEIRRKLSSQRIQTKVPTAAVVLTNPTHYAVALRYDRGTDVAPVCVAKGTDLIAAQIRRVARENDVVVIENRALARALFQSAEMDETIPSDHWQAVAQIIGYVLDLKARLYRLPPAGSSIRLED